MILKYQLLTFERKYVTMEYSIIRITIGILTGFIALTAIGGGVALLVGAEDERFPLAWLEGTPFKSYTIPALLLAVVVGGSALAACMTIFINFDLGLLAAVLSGLLLIGYITIEVMILKQIPPGPTVIEYLYFGLGSSIVVIAGYMWLTERTLSG